MSHTYESEAHSSLSTIDHILCSQHLLPQVSRARTLEEDVLNTSDHIPVMAELCFPSSPVHSTPTDTATNNSCPPRRNWDGITKANIKHLYTIPLQPQLKEIQQSIQPFSSQTIILINSLNLWFQLFLTPPLTFHQNCFARSKLQAGLLHWKPHAHARFRNIATAYGSLQVDRETQLTLCLWLIRRQRNILDNHWDKPGRNATPH